MMRTLAVIGDTVRSSLRPWLAMVFGFVAFYYLALLIIVIARLGHLPNYVTFYDWPANVWKIIRSTPSVRDMLPIIAEEWVFETGYMNYSYGHGVAEWSLALIPWSILAVAALGALAATSLLLLRRARRHCLASTKVAGATAAGFGSLLVGITNVTMTWIACCSTPSWVVGLSLIGIETSSAYLLLPYGNLLSSAGFATLAATNWALARRCLPQTPRRSAPTPRHLAIQDL